MKLPTKFTQTTKRTLTTAALIFAVSTSAQAGPQCSEGKTADWIPAETMQQQITDMGYKIKKFKESRGHCYEIYGWDQDGHKVEVYFHPVTGKIIKQEIED